MRAALAARRARIEELLARGEPTEAALHDLRVALRRTAAAARLTRGVPRHADGEALREVAGDLRRSLSAQRTREVCAAILRRRFRDAARKETARRLADDLRSDAAAPAQPMTPRLRVLRHAFDVREAQLLAPSPADSRALEERLRKVVRRRLRKRRDRLVAAGVPESDTLHAARIGAKELRYSLELVAEAMPEAGPLLLLLQEFQGHAGDAHDRAELLEDVRRRVPRLPAARARAARGLLPALAADAERTLRRAQASARRLLPALQRAPLDWAEPSRNH